MALKGQAGRLITFNWYFMACQKILAIVARCAAGQGRYCQSLGQNAPLSWEGR